MTEPREQGAGLPEASGTGVAESLTVRSEAASEVGKVLLGAGMASYRVKWAMARTAHRLGLDSFHAVVTYTDIIATATLDGRYRTRVTMQDKPGVNVDVLNETQRLVENLPQRISAIWLFRQLDRITARKARYGPVMNPFAAGMACAGFCFLNAGGPVEIASVFVASTVGQIIRRLMNLRSLNHFLVTLVAAFVTSLAYLGVISLVGLAGGSTTTHQAGYLAAMLYLIPGFPLVTGMLDLIRNDFSAGLSRLAYAIVMIMAAGVAVWSIADLGAVSTQMVVHTPDSPFWRVLGTAIATFAGVLGFAMIFNSPPRIAFGAAAVALVFNTLRWCANWAGLPTQLNTLVAAICIGVTAWGIARRFHVPRTAISVPATVIMIPGFSLYAAWAQINAGNVTDSVASGTDALLVILAIPMGLAIAHLMTSRAWRHMEDPR